MPIKVEITHKTILFTIGILILGWFLLQIEEILLLLFLAFILMSALKVAVDTLERFKIPRLLSILLVYGILLSSLIFIGTATLPGLIAQTVLFWQQLPVILNRFLPFFSLNLEFLTTQITPVSGDLIKVTFAFFSNLFTLLNLLVLTFYFLLERQSLEKNFIALFGQTNGNKLIKIFQRIEERLGYWVRGQFILMMLIGLSVFIGLTILKVDYALPLAITAGLLEIVPIVGSIISALPAVLVALTVSPALALAVLALYFIINQLEGNLIVPTVMKRAVGFSPLVTLIALMIGGKIAGITGALLAVPLVVILQAILQEISAEKKA